MQSENKYYKEVAIQNLFLPLSQAKISKSVS